MQTTSELQAEISGKKKANSFKAAHSTPASFTAGLSEGKGNHNDI